MQVGGWRLTLSGWLTHGGHQLTHLQAKPGLHNPYDDKGKQSP